MTQNEKALEENIKEYYEKIINNIETTGWQAILVGKDLTSDIPHYIYSVGLNSTAEHPEIFISGLPSGIDAQVLMKLSNKIINENFMVKAYKVYTDILENMNVVFLHIKKDKAKELHVADVIYGDGLVVYQMVWSDENGKFPWEDDFSESLKDSQQILGNIPERKLI